MHRIEYKGKKAIVTGGAGFIGSHLTEALVTAGCQTIVIDNYSTGRLKNLEAIKDDKHLSIVESDVNDMARIRSFFKEVDYVFHLAALADIVPSIVNPLAYHRANVDGTISILEVIREMAPDIRKFVYTASSSCYGIPDVFPTPETSAIRPQYPYALTKYIGEQIALNWGHIYKLPIISLRLFNVYGPRSRTSGTYGAVFGVFLAQKLAGKPFTVVGDGNQTRDFTFVLDVVNAFLIAGLSNVKGDMFNVGSGQTYSVNRLVELLQGPIVHIPKRPGEPDCTFAETKKISTALNWQPAVNFEDGVKTMLDKISCWAGAPVWDPESIKEATSDWFKYLSKGN